VRGLCDRRYAPALQQIGDHRVRVFERSLRHVEAVKEAGMSRAVVPPSASPSMGARQPGLANIWPIYEVRIEGGTTVERGLASKPAPETFLDAHRRLGVKPSGTAIFEDTPSGVAAGHARRSGFVVGVDRVGRAAAFAPRGADRVGGELADFEAPRTSFR
jgi:hypothetical protein